MQFLNTKTQSREDAKVCLTSCLRRFVLKLWRCLFIERPIMERARVAIVGMGVGKTNGRAIARHPRGAIVALCDLYQDRMRQFADELPDPVPFYTDYRELCRAPDIDAVFV